jgi:hypothetical protein
MALDFGKRRRQAAERQRDYKDAFGTSTGRRVLKDMCDRCGVFIPFTHLDAHNMAIQEGRREAVMDILRTLAIDEAALMTLYQEMEDDRINEHGN